ncbi:hypothetical protein GBAR_LOCUS447 [Geodia barretti]|uniref:EF-hand domain-containing protein n=1 Tax=Geodia barretti TaxID=519541 RepID=A0AA35QSG0_GEOBA|nr:hypothetical protein GBAR_LOCUS447 [Geodia barretti]
MFRSSAGTKGYITKEEVMQKTLETLEAYPALDAEELKEHARKVWIEDLCCGMDPPAGYHLTEAQFVQNMWVMVNQPSLKERTRKATEKVMQQLDKAKKGYVTKDEYLRMTRKLVSEEHLQRIFDALDETKQGKVTRESMEKMYTHYFTDTEDEEHPFNLLRGPLVD